MQRQKFYHVLGMDNLPATMTLGHRGHYPSLCVAGQSGSKIMRVDGTDTLLSRLLPSFLNHFDPPHGG